MSHENSLEKTETTYSFAITTRTGSIQFSVENTVNNGAKILITITIVSILFSEINFH